MRLHALVGSLVLVGCGGSPGAPDARSDASPDAPPRPDAAPDAPPPPPDPWLQPTGDLVPSVILADGWTDLRLLPPPLAITGGWTDSLFALPDGEHLRFAYAPMDFFTFFTGGGASVTGPQLLGTTGSSFKLFDATLTATGWTIGADPVAAPDPAVVEASPATNASDDLFVFTRFDATGRSQLYYAELVGGAWTTPAALPVNSAACNDDNAKVRGELATGVTIYFESNRGEPAGSSATCGQRTLYTTTYSGGAFSPVTAVPGIATATSDDSQPFLSADGQTLYWTSVRDTALGVFAATRQGDGSFAQIREVVPAVTAEPFADHLALVGEASVVDTTEGELLYLMCGVAYDTHGGHTYHDADDIQLHPCVARRPR